MKKKFKTLELISVIFLIGIIFAISGNLLISPNLNSYESSDPYKIYLSDGKLTADYKTSYKGINIFVDKNVKYETYKTIKNTLKEMPDYITTLINSIVITTDDINTRMGYPENANANVLGCSDGSNIYVSDRADPNESNSVFIHETAHVLDFNYSITSSDKFLKMYKKAIALYPKSELIEVKWLQSLSAPEFWAYGYEFYNCNYYSNYYQLIKEKYPNVLKYIKKELELLEDSYISETT